MIIVDLTLFLPYTVRPKLFDRLKAALWKLVTSLYTSLIKLNIFSLWVFGSNTNRMTATRRGQWATRLYIILLIISFVIMIFYMGLRPQILTKTLNRPSFDVYSRLAHDYEDILQCSCSSISSTYDQFVQIEPVFHQVR
jgi:NADH:ubiquinone oxidoreductase subunit 4 (subunit M)